MKKPRFDFAGLALLKFALSRHGLTNMELVEPLVWD